MIQTTLSNLILYNLCGLLLLLGIMWVCRIVRERHREHRRRRHEVICGLCGHLFTETSRAETVQCPACHNLVQRQKLLNL